MPELIPSGDAAFQLVWTTPRMPADLNRNDNGVHDAGLTLRSGSVMRIVDMLPGRASPMHRSVSIDYGIVLAGTLERELDGGKLVSYAPDAATEAQFARQPPLRTPRAERLGFRHDTDLESLVRTALATLDTGGQPVIDQAAVRG